jgi:hypothetical protein
LFVLAAFMASTSATTFAKQPHQATPFGIGLQQAPANATASQSGRVQYAIPAGPLGDLLERFEQTSGVRLMLAMPEMTALQSAGVSGFYTVQEALEQLVSGTSLSARLTAADVALLDIQGQSESVQVTATAPTVRSPKYQVPLRDIAQTIAIIPRAVMEEQGATTLSAALRNVPGITLQAGEGGGSSNTAGDMFNMRGFNASNSLFVDGVRDDGLISRDVFNLEQVEVFLGPDRLGRWPRHGCWLREHEHEDAARRDLLCRSVRRRHRRTVAPVGRCELGTANGSPGQLGQQERLSSERPVAGLGSAGPRRS